MKEREPGQKPMYMGSEEITICGGNEGVTMDERSYHASWTEYGMKELE